MVVHVLVHLHVTCYMADIVILFTFRRAPLYLYLFIVIVKVSTRNFRIEFLYLVLRSNNCCLQLILVIIKVQQIIYLGVNKKTSILRSFSYSRVDVRNLDLK